MKTGGSRGCRLLPPTVRGDAKLRGRRRNSPSNSPGCWKPSRKANCRGRCGNSGASRVMKTATRNQEAVAAARLMAEPRIGKEIPDGGVGVGYGNDHQKSERGKFANISALFRSISSAEGAGPYFARRPRKECVGSFAELVLPGGSSRIPSSASRTKSAAERPRACATAMSLASSRGCSGKVIVRAGPSSLSTIPDTGETVTKFPRWDSGLSGLAGIESVKK